jgi:hypothetical protein
MQKGLQSSCLFGSWYVSAQDAIFFAKPYSINAGETSIVLWIAGKKFHHSTTRTKIELHFGGFFQCASQ